MDDPAVRDELTRRTLELCRQPSVTGREAALADRLEEAHASEPVIRVGDSLVVGGPGGEAERASPARPLVLLVGHIDTVPPTGEDREPRVEPRDGQEVIVGRGASDMKGGVAVGQALHADRRLRASSPYALALVLYAGEEGPDEGNELRRVLAEVAWLAGAALAVVLEPSDLEVQAGCLGGLHAEVTFPGRPAHSARPWLGDNALTAAGEFLADLHRRQPVEVEVDGLVYRDVITATRAWTPQGPRNVIPDRFTVNVNYRFAPSRDLEAAEEELRALVGDRAEVRVVDRAPPAPPALDSPVVGRLLAAAGAPVTAKQAWTDVARLAQVGVPAVNFGPGLTAQAHRRGEYVPVANLVETHRRLHRFLAG